MFYNLSKALLFYSDVVILRIQGKVSMNCELIVFLYWYIFQYLCCQLTLQMCQVAV